MQYTWDCSLQQKQIEQPKGTLTYSLEWERAGPRTKCGIEQKDVLRDLTFVLWAEEQQQNTKINFLL